MKPGEHKFFYKKNSEGYPLCYSVIRREGKSPLWGRYQYRATRNGISGYGLNAASAITACDKNTAQHYLSTATGENF